MTKRQKEGQPTAVGMLEEAFRWMDKALRSLAIYTREHQVARSFETSTAQHLAAIPEQEGETWLEVRAKTLRHGERAIYHEDPETEGFVFRMHRDGIRRICLLPGLSLDEVSRLVGVFQADLDAPEHFDDDMVTLMWDAELDSIKVIVADLLTLLPDDADLRPYQELMNGIIAAAMEAGLPDGQEPRRDLETVRLSLQVFGELDPEQVIAALAAVDAGPGVAPFEDEERRLAELREAYHTESVLERFVEILYRGVAFEPDHAERACASFDLLIQALLAKRRHADLLDAVVLLNDLDGNLMGTAGTAARMLERLGESERVRDLVSCLDSSDADVDAVMGVVRHLPPGAAADVLAAAAELPDRQHREALVPVVAELCRGCPERLSSSLESVAPLEVRMALDALVAIGTEEALGCLRPLRRHEAPDMRITMLRLTQDLRSEALTEVRRAMLEDPHPRVRAEAERCLARVADPELVKRLFRRLVDGTLRDQSPAEKRRVCAILGAAGGEREVRLLEELVRRGRVLSGRRQQELCVAAAHGLAATGERRHLEILQQTADRRLMARQVRDACRQAAEALRSGRKPQITRVAPPAPAAEETHAARPEEDPHLPALDPSQREVEPGGAPVELALTEDDEAPPVLPALDPSERDTAAGTVGDRAEGLLPALEDPAPGPASDRPDDPEELGELEPPPVDLGFVDLEGDGVLPTVEAPAMPPAAAGEPAAPAESGDRIVDPDLDALLRGYVDTVAAGGGGVSGGDGAGRRDDAVDELLRRYIEAEVDGSPRRNSGGQERQDGDLEALLRSYVEEKE